MACLKGASEYGEPESCERVHSCADDGGSKELDIPARGLLDAKTEVPLISEDYYRVSVPEACVVKFEVGDTFIKEEQGPTISMRDNSELMDTSAHSDHNYSEGSVVKQEYPQNSAPVGEQNVQSPDSGHALKQEAKVCPQTCETHVKKEANKASAKNNIYVKTETCDNAGLVSTSVIVKDTNVNNNRNLQYPCLQTYKCSKCNSHFGNEQVLKIHVAKCGSRGDSLAVPYVKTVKSMPATKMHKCNQCDPSHAMKKLIECVRKHPCLYRRDHEDCKNTQIKTGIWTSIASDCSLPNGSVARAEWQKLKTTFIDLIKRQNSIHNGHSRKQPLKWKYYQLMEFMLPYISNRQANSDVQNEHCDNEADGQMQVPAPEINIDEDADEDCTMVTSAPPAKKAKIAPPQTTNFPKTPQRNREERSEPLSRDGARPSTSSQPLDMFFLSMCETTKNLPPYVQLQVKKKIFQAVIEAEEIVAAMNNDQEKFNSSTNMNEDYTNSMSPFSVHSAGIEDSPWQDD